LERTIIIIKTVIIIGSKIHIEKPTCQDEAY
jgi:hypothetical protein